MLSLKTHHSYLSPSHLNTNNNITSTTPTPNSYPSEKLFLQTTGTPLTINTPRPPDPSVTTSATSLLPPSSTHQHADILTSILGKCTTHRSDYHRPKTTKKVTWAQAETYHTYLPDPPTPLHTNSLGSTNPTVMASTTPTSPLETSHEEPIPPPEDTAYTNS